MRASLVPVLCEGVRIFSTLNSRAEFFSPPGLSHSRQRARARHPSTAQFSTPASAESLSTSRPDPLCYLAMEEARAAEQALKEAAAKAAARSAAATTVSAPADARSSLANMIRGRAGCSSAGGRAAAAASGAAEIVVSGCGNESINGTYRRDGERDGVPCYRHVSESRRGTQAAPSAGRSQLAPQHSPPRRPHPDRRHVRVHLVASPRCDCSLRTA